MKERAMRVLMLGWEFPPYISGGLGTACQGLAMAMSQLDTKVLFLLPEGVGMCDSSDSADPQSFENLRIKRVPERVPNPYGVTPNLFRPFPGEMGQSTQETKSQTP